MKMTTNQKIRDWIQVLGCVVGVAICSIQSVRVNVNVCVCVLCLCVSPRLSFYIKYSIYVKETLHALSNLSPPRQNFHMFYVLFAAYFNAHYLWVQNWIAKTQGEKE